MVSLRKTTLYYSFLALSFCLSLPVLAQQPDALTTPTPHAEWQGQLDEHAQRQEFREESQKIRADHEELEVEHDLIKSSCMDAKGQEQMACHDRWKSFKQKYENLHERIKTLRSKMDADHSHQKHLNNGASALPKSHAEQDPE